jgi:hypothetical protein
MRSSIKVLTVLVIGIGIGLWLAHKPEQPSNLSAEVVPHAEAISKPPAEQAQGSAARAGLPKLPNPRSVPTFAVKNELKTIPMDRTVKRANAVDTAPQDLHLSLSNEDLDDLELHERDLSNKLRVWRTDEGWKIEVLAADPILDRIGLRNGDLITYDGLKRQLAKSESMELASRMSTLLERMAQ